MSDPSPNCNCKLESHPQLMRHHTARKASIMIYGSVKTRKATQKRMDQASTEETGHLNGIGDYGYDERKD